MSKGDFNWSLPYHTGLWVDDWECWVNERDMDGCGTSLFHLRRRNISILLSIRIPFISFLSPYLWAGSKSWALRESEEPAIGCDSRDLGKKNLSYETTSEAKKEGRVWREAGNGRYWEYWLAAEWQDELSDLAEFFLHWVVWFVFHVVRNCTSGCSLYLGYE